MEGLRQWLLGIVFTAFAVGLARQLAPEGREQAAVRLAGGLLMLLAVLGPLAGGDWGDLALPAGAFQASEVAEDYEAQRTAALGAVIAEKTAAYIWDKAQELGLAVAIDVTVEEDGSYPYPAAVRITGPFTEPQRQSLTRYIEENLAIGKEQQTWTNE